MIVNTLHKGDNKDNNDDDDDDGDDDNDDDDNNNNNNNNNNSDLYINHIVVPSFPPSKPASRIEMAN